ncbi:DUF192 domain-containing protein [Leptolyngbya ohadii]|uniref:DUF192 domain-containing protein n=1 Tax=Leptolyngbya ohadii TaxID=1962290 RepID=UPI000B59C138|nr:DUF192 domain-containing protein [Leptolyngbya ohadii]
MVGPNRKTLLGLIVLVIGFVVAMAAVESLEQSVFKHISQSQSQAVVDVQSLPIAAQFKVNDRTIKLEVARTVQERQIGLMNRPRLAPDRGMGFAVSPPRDVEIWMKQMKFPIDIIFLNNGRIKAIQTKAPPCPTEVCPTYQAGTPVDQVVELAAGEADRLGLKVGDFLPITRIQEPNQSAPLK